MYCMCHDKCMCKEIHAHNNITHKINARVRNFQEVVYESQVLDTTNSTPCQYAITCEIIFISELRTCLF